MNDDEINVLFMEKVCGYTWQTNPGFHGGTPTLVNGPLDPERFPGWSMAERPKNLSAHGFDDFLHDANAVLPWLEKENQWSCVNHQSFGCWGYTVLVCAVPPTTWRGEADTFAKAAVIALLRAHGVEAPSEAKP